MIDPRSVSPGLSPRPGLLHLNTHTFKEASAQLSTILDRHATRRAMRIRASTHQQVRGSCICQIGFHEFW